ncbi:two-component system activity regulator YycH [Alicyclobacillus dauci]|uniref:Two-component system activity regulator YycH n=1 Tax=Alicyclobacillus dauci TaxID=1475485 RepID=A0ABY6Z3S4_9BACL|nr:two-component system activity regulator YycH [Alicyclobacillus dauci]WAH36981.1 two-component system activity regulator YycH [Alicyclobacillus dauci]
MNRVIRISKTVLLVLLVGASIVLSYFLWSDNLHEGSDIGFVSPAPTPTATTPSIESAVRPYMVTVGTLQGLTVLGPGSNGYQYWTNALTSAHTYDPVTLKALPPKTEMKVTYEFGIQLTHQLAGKWVANLGTALSAWEGRTIVLYAVPGDKVCRVGLVGSNNVMTVKTDLNLSTLINRASLDIKSEPYDTWGVQDQVSYVPRNLMMMRQTVQIRQPDALPLVHSFFVNPQAVTRIQQDKNTFLWTDGSRAVQWNQGKEELRYEDPNGSQLNLHNDPFITALDFIHTHGGGPQNVIGFDQLSTLTIDPDVPAYVFTQFVDGYPVLSTGSDYDVDLQNGRVMEYNRPMWVLQQPITQTPVSVLDKAQLLRQLKKVDSNPNPTDLHVILGYAMEPVDTHTDQATLEPVYYVTNDSGSSWVVNASDGTLMSGSDAS